MPCERKPMRYGHSEGHTEVCFDDTGKFIVTCGHDGDVRIWENLDDDDPRFITVGEKAYSLALKNGKLVTANSSNAVQIHTFPDGEPDGILTRFTTNATHVTFNTSGSKVAAGSSDFLVKVVEVSDSSQQKTLRGHEAPVLSVTFDPKGDFLASASCDGSVVVWNIEEQAQVISWPVLQKTNDVSNAKSLCRLAWQPRTAKFLAVPVETKVHLYERESWNHVTTLSDDLLNQPINVAAWSPCGNFLAAASVGGFIIVWDIESKLCVERQKHEKGFTVCGLAWHPSGSQIAYTDTEGCLGLLEGFRASVPTTNTPKVPAGKPERGYEDLFDDEDDDQVMDEGCSDANSPAKKAASGVQADEEDDDDFVIPATGRVKNRGAILDDENSLDSGSLKFGRPKFGDDNDDDADSAVMTAGPLPATLRPVYEGPQPTPPQKAFQPGSTPVHLTHRFMMWNSVGTVRGYNDEQDNAIDVEFHDTAVHHAMHLTNSLGHTMTDVSQEAVLLACASTNELASKIHCLHFSSWDTNKEWMVDLPQGEDARALCLGQGWAAVATSTLIVRLFTIGGVQREIFSLPGAVVCMAGHGEQLLIVYHRGTGFDGEQALGVQLLQFGRKRRQIINGEPLPISQKSYLCWLGFTAEGTPCYVDSEGVVRMLNRSLGFTWTPVCNTRDTCKSKSDHYWVVGVHENPQQLRCIPCKGSRYPPTLPRPAVAILPFKLPLCQTTTEKGQMEEQFWRSVLFHNHYSFLSSSGYEVDEVGQSQSQKEQQELLMKMFALSCKLEREFRCVELAELMTQNVVTLAIRYASKSRRMALAQRLSEIALEKASQIQEEEQEDVTEYSDIRQTSSGRSSYDQTDVREKHHRRQTLEDERSQELEEEEGEREIESEDGVEAPKRLNPFAKVPGSSLEQATPLSSKVGRPNPFKVLGSGKSSPVSCHPRVKNILDHMTPSRKLAPLSASAGKSNRSPVLKPLPPRAKGKAQSTLLEITGAKAVVKKTQEILEARDDQQKKADAPTAPSPADNAETVRPKTGFQLWLEENRKNITADHPDLEETDIIKEAMGLFRNLSADERLAWTERAKGLTGDVKDLKKRKRTEAGGGIENEIGQLEANENDAKKKKAMDPSSKLSAFAFHKD
ncbi:WD repeat and HMG-box DNA-binding protein 1 isoform X1 [Hippocampus comes]|uniref:WD repeat and HMG-box DNA-binding protein 1 isoform X1 n=1 Tax=Hippocampus comes TaxID=109280 RepID=UPI00094EA3E4|nr:PREDICTED: WD repeat and HMG-box DNA-binding protein 1 isoform X1 [Hippocampus comes]XP_019723127.1 PREDICTED: WD repeat and HMG-box DNA-binding protein 1 isoform X1 [Hippocampus comes]